MTTRITEISSRATGLPVQAIREVMELAWKQPDAIHLEVGEPGFPTPPHIVEAAARAARDGHTKYTPNAGIAPLREALAAKVGRVNGYEASPDQVVVGAGGVQVLHNILLALTDPGDEILMPDPAWPDFVQMAHLLDTPPRFYHQTPETRFLPAIEELEELVTPRTRVLIVNSPSNPLGAVVPAALSAELVAFAERHGLWLVSDECYDEIAFDGTFASPMAVAPSPRVISAYSFSKVYAMTGWRVGYCVAPPEVAATLTRLQEPIVSCVNAPAQMAALAAVTGPQDIVVEMRDAYRERRDAAVALLSEAGVGVLRPAGAFYLWVDIAPSGRDSRDFAFSLIAERGVACAPGTAFGAAGEGFVRLSMASELDVLLEGARRLVEHLGTRSG
ncbi:pyridoxal phosphate-dependent aminotransferase [Candidatus Solirubrobacter pratensis]|uniref:pyridoxal phosphate-dependent aminotransferase n=1 Tax=Candidatus Solirubrobacter pratensis TaxID=1298857 RepID=UPI0004069A76|nr:aminotransferase class I/II-fold pyridoxal phosphate-dependent enzyme [Candidatus Solirubrobacter pratensis]